MTDRILEETFTQIEDELNVLRELAFVAIEEKAATEEILAKGERLAHDGRLYQVTKMRSNAAKKFDATLKIVQAMYPDKVAEAKAEAEKPLNENAE